ncbi:kinase-like domain-containing protein [Mycena alexandri]|uniref:Kinase-like domain-containing protein n=1 Tax=Mycena alexandri TaxID=1745969 RepID=A0AAD6SVK7_9AGAR|nr:kinase-like domain-containing protein [Mycena alexandri]
MSGDFIVEIASEIFVFRKLKTEPHRNLLSFIPEDDFNSVRRFGNHTAIFMEYHPTSLLYIQGDIPPENLCAMLYATVALEIDGHCVIADYGSCYASKNVEELSSSAGVMVTALYAAPETIEFDAEQLLHFNNRCDYFSLGKTLYYLLGNLSHMRREASETEDGTHDQWTWDSEVVMINHLGLSGSPPELTKVIVSLCHLEPNQRIHGEELTSALQNIGRLVEYLEILPVPFTVIWYPGTGTPLLQWNSSMKPLSTLHTSGLFLSRTVRHHPQPRPHSGSKQSDSNESNESNDFNDPNNSNKERFPETYHVLPPHLVKYVGKIADEPVVGDLCVQKWNGAEHVVQVISSWPQTELVTAAG